jgi:antitoxin ParD1/3/4
MSNHVAADVEERIREKVESGYYPDASEVLRVALRLLDARDRRIQEIRSSIEEGLAAVERGEGHEWTPELMEQISGEADERIRLGIPPKPDVCP